MYVDNNLMMSDAQAVTASAASTKSIDAGLALRDIGSGEPVYLVIKVDTTATSGGTTTVDFALQDSADNSSFADTGVKVSGIAKATLVAGYQVLAVALPIGLRRYIQVYYTVNSNNLTAGAFTATLVKDLQANVSRPSGFTV